MKIKRHQVLDIRLNGLELLLVLQTTGNSRNRWNQIRLHTIPVSTILSQNQELGTSTHHHKNCINTALPNLRRNQLHHPLLSEMNMQVRGGGQFQALDILQRHVCSSKQSSPSYIQVLVQIKPYSVQQRRSKGSHYFSAMLFRRAQTAPRIVLLAFSAQRWAWRAYLIGIMSSEYYLGLILILNPRSSTARVEAFRTQFDFQRLGSGKGR